MAGLVASLLLLTPMLHASTVIYNRCNRTDGPLWGGWAGSCASRTHPQSEGSPINLCAAIPFQGEAPAITVTNYGEMAMKLENLGRTVEVKIEATEPATLNAKDLAYIVGRASTSYEATWQLEQIHFHWGRNYEEGSEHYMQGKPYPMEAHLVHFNTLYGTSVANAIANRPNTTQDAVLVVGVFLKIEEGAKLGLVDTIADTIPAAGEEVELEGLTPADLFNSTLDGSNYYSYRGSLTTPGCTEVVTWVVMQTPKLVSSETVAKFLEVRRSEGEGSELTSKYGNFRPLQPVNGRTIYSSSGATARCTNVKEPVFPCSDTRPLRGATQNQ